MRGHDVHRFVGTTQRSRVGERILQSGGIDAFHRKYEITAAQQFEGGLVPNAGGRRSHWRVNFTPRLQTSRPGGSVRSLRIVCEAGDDSPPLILLQSPIEGPVHKRTERE